MTQRAFVFGLIILAACLGAFSLSSVADAQQPALPRSIGVLQTAAWSEEMVQAFLQALHDAGYSEEQDLAIEWRYAKGDYHEIPRLIADLVERKVAVIVTDSTPGTRVAKGLTSSIPIVMVFVSDPVGSGLVASLGHPGGNVTGNSIMAPDLVGKRLQLLKETIPGLRRVAVLWNPDTPFHPKVIEQLKAAAPPLSIELTFVSARTPEEIGPAFGAATRARAQALYVIEDGLFFNARLTLVQLASKGKLPAVYWQRNFADDGGLMSYGANVLDSVRRSTRYVDKILKGAHPRDLPIEQPTQFELVVNLRAAQGLGLRVPESILLRADKVIR